MAHLIQAFDLTNEFNILRLACGLFLLPHLFAKASDLQTAYAIYRDWKLTPPKPWVLACIAVETVGAIGLVFALYTRYVAALVAVFMLVAAWACWRRSGGRWLWQPGGIEYPLFWAIACLVVALHG